MAEYSLVEPMAETITVHRQRASVLTVARTFSREQTLRSALFPGLELQLEDVFSS